MTKQTMIWQTLSMIIAGMAVNKKLPETKELFEKNVIFEAKSLLEYSEEDIKEVLCNTDCLKFAKIMCKINTNKL